MTRFNYLREPSARRFARSVAPYRGPVAVLAATAALIGVIALVLAGRLAAAAADVDVASHRLAESDRSVAAIRILADRVAERTRLVDDADDIRRTGEQRVNELTWIANHLPADAWLSAVRYDRGVYSLEGESERIVAVGAAIVSLHAGGKTPSLVSLGTDPHRPGARVRYTLRLEPPP
jgi:hypothetical protein